MAKATPLSIDTLTTPQLTPQAATPPRGVVTTPKPPAAPKVKHVPLQLKIPERRAKAIRRAALERDFPTVSEYMLTCHEAYEKANK